MLHLTSFVGEEQVEDASEHFHRLGESLGTPVETRQVVSNGTVETLHPMRFGFRDEVRFAYPMTLEHLFVARIAIRAERHDLRFPGLDLIIQANRRLYPFSDLIRNNTTFPSTISSSYDRSILFFLQTYQSHPSR
jgi:hypothetical protein